MSIRVFSLDFVSQGGIVYPADVQLHKLAIEYAERALAVPVNFADYRKILVACEIDADGKPLNVIGLGCGVLKFDLAVMRFSSVEAGEQLIERLRGYLDDQAAKGSEVFVYVAPHEAKESRCPKWKKFLKSVGAVKSNRWSVKA